MITTFCPRCGSENPFENHFCGKCGIPLLQPKPAEPVAVAQARNGRSAPLPEAEPNGDGTISGPSFLGLSDEPDLSTNYLLDDDVSRTHWGLVFFLLVLAVGGVLVWWQVRKGGFDSAHLASLVQQAKSKIAQQTQEARGTAPGATPSAAENSGVGTASPAPPNSQPAAGSTTQAHDGNGASTPAASTNPPPSAAEIQNAAEKERTPAAPGALSEAAAAAIPPKAVAKPQPRKREPEVADTAPSQDAQNAALLNNAQKYLYGEGVPQSCDRALADLRQAADNGSSKAKSTLGGLYATGHCVPLDRATAYKWFALALRGEPNNSYLSHDLEMLWNQMTPAEKQLALRITH